MNTNWLFENWMEQPSASDPFPPRFVSMRNLHARECQLMKKYSASSIFDFIDYFITDVFLSVTKVFIRKAKRLSKYEDGVV